LGIGHGVVALRYDVTERHHVRGGLGGIRYTSEARELFRDGGELRPLVEGGGGVGWRAGGVRIGLGVAGQAHGFGTTAFRSAGGPGGRGADGTVLRLADQAGRTRARGRRGRAGGGGGGRGGVARRGGPARRGRARAGVGLGERGVPVGGRVGRGGGGWARVPARGPAGDPARAGGGVMPGARAGTRSHP